MVCLAEQSSGAHAQAVVTQLAGQLRDGARSFYCYDPDGTLVQMIHHPEVSQWEQLKGVN